MIQNLRKWRLRDKNPPRLWRMGYVLALTAAISIGALVGFSWLALALLSYPRLPHARLCRCTTPPACFNSSSLPWPERAPRWH